MKNLKYFFLILSLFGFGYAVDQTSNQAVVINPYSMPQYNQEFSNFYKTHPASQSANVAERVSADSGFFLGKPYVLGALGEGPTAKFDQSPLYRTDAFDCMTYVSTVLAMAESKNFQQFRQHMLDVQYSNHSPSYLTRNHFVSVDWNVNNEKQGFLTDVTKKLFPNDYKIADALINKPNWFAKLKADNIKQFKPLSEQETKQRLDEMHALGEKTKAVVSLLSYVPLTALYGKNGKPIMRQFDKIPSGAVIEIVRPNWVLAALIGTNLNVSHLGLGVRINHVLMFREASSIHNKVVDIPLSTYLAGYLNSATVKGINIQQIN